MFIRLGVDVECSHKHSFFLSFSFFLSLSLSLFPSHFHTRIYTHHHSLTFTLVCSGNVRGIEKKEKSETCFHKEPLSTKRRDTIYRKYDSPKIAAPKKLVRSKFMNGLFRELNIISVSNSKTK